MISSRIAEEVIMLIRTLITGAAFLAVIPLLLLGGVIVWIIGAM